MNSLSWVYLPSAFVLGMAHALEPGHSKAIMASYLVSIKGKATDAAALGLTVTVTHTLVIFVLALGVLALGTAFPMDEIQHGLEFSSALLVFAMGGWLLQSRIHDWRHEHDPSHTADHHHHCHHGHEHSHDVPLGHRLSLKELISFGLAGGLAPCPAALAILILAVGTGKPVLGLVTVLIFSLGLAATLMGIGIAVCKGVNVFQSKLNLERWTQWLPIGSAALIMLLGAAMLAGIMLGHGH